MRVTTLGVLIVAVVVLGVGFMVVVFRSKQSQQTAPPTNQATTSAESERQLQVTQNLLSLRATTEVQDRIVLFGSTLINPATNVVRSRLEQAFAFPVVTVALPAGTTRDGIAQLPPVLASPPKFLVLDLGRFDAAAGIPLSETVSNLSLIFSKARALGITVILIGGIGSDGDTRLAESTKLVATEGTRFLDATTLFLSSQYRSTGYELNDVGTEKLSSELVTIITSFQSP